MVHKDQTLDSTHTYPSTSYQNYISMGTHQTTLQPKKYVWYDWLLAGMPLCLSPESTKDFHMSKGASQVFAGIVELLQQIHTRLADKDNRVHQRGMHFQSGSLC